MASPPAPAAVRTTFYIPNLHCASCVDRVRALLAQFRARPAVSSISVSEHAVSIVHPPSLLASSIRDALERNGYEVYDMHLDPQSNERHPFGDEAPDFDHAAFQAAIRRWQPHHQLVDEKARRRHLEFCETCRAELPDDVTPTSERAALSLPANESSTLSSFSATLSVEGMTCSSCVGNVSRALEALPFVQSASVNLMSHSASVQFAAWDGHSRVKELVEAIEDSGYDAALQDVERKEHEEPVLDKEAGSNTWEAEFAIEGMTCSSCVGNVTKAVEALDYVHEVNVNLVQHAGTVAFHGKENVEKIKEAIEDSGYDASLVELYQTSAVQQPKKQSMRTVSIKIDGMHCRRCPQRVRDALAKLPLTVEKPVELDAPILVVSYVPDAPKFTIRHIISALSEVDAAFTVSIHHPPSLEERSRALVARERKHILYRIILSGLLAVPTFIIGIIIMNFISHDTPSYTYWMGKVAGVPRAEWATFALSTPVYFFAADLFHRRTMHELKVLWKPTSKVPVLRRFYRFGSMNMLVSFGNTIAYVASLTGLVIEATNPKYANDPSRQSYFDSVVFLTLFLLVGRYAEAQMKSKSGDAVAALGKLRPSEAHVKTVSDYGSVSSLKKVNVDLVDVGDQIKVFNGTSAPCDGVVVEGSSKFDESSLTGESRLVAKQPGDTVYTGTVNGGNSLTIKVTGTAGSSMLDSIINVVREGQSKRAPIERVADMLTGYFVPVICFLAVSTWLIWMTLGLSGALPASYKDTRIGGWPFWSLQFAIAVFVIACPCGLGLAAPTVLFVGSGMAAQRGILVKGGGEAFQEASQLDCVVFDKTGTLTQGGEPQITNSEYLSSLSRGDVLAILKAVEENSSHPLARAAVAHAARFSPATLAATDVAELPGRGLKASVALSPDQYEVLIGNEALLESYAVRISNSAASTLETWSAGGASLILLALRPATSSEFQIAAIFAASDPIRAEAPGIISALHTRGIDVWMLSGDNARTAQAIGAQVGIPPANIIAGVLPDQKAAKIGWLQQAVSAKRKDRAIVAMVGDGINDAPALTAADVGIAIGSGADVALASASFVLLNSHLRTLLTLIDLSRAVFTRVKVNFAWAGIYNILALPFAAGVFYPLVVGGAHVRLDPAFAALAMALSSISVVGSSLLLRTRIWGVGFRDREGMVQLE